MPAFDRSPAEKRGTRIYFAYDTDYELLENGKYLKIIRYKRDGCGQRIIDGADLFEKISGAEIRDRRVVEWRPCWGESEGRRPFEKYRISCYVDRHTNQCYYKIIRTIGFDEKVTYYTKKDKKHEV